MGKEAIMILYGKEQLTSSDMIAIAVEHGYCALEVLMRDTGDLSALQRSYLEAGRPYTVWTGDRYGDRTYTDAEGNITNTETASYVEFDKDGYYHAYSDKAAPIHQGRYMYWVQALTVIQRRGFPSIKASTHVIGKWVDFTVANLDPDSVNLAYFDSEIAYYHQLRRHGLLHCGGADRNR